MKTTRHEIRIQDLKLETAPALAGGLFKAPDGGCLDQGGELAPPTTQIIGILIAL